MTNRLVPKTNLMCLRRHVPVSVHSVWLDHLRYWYECFPFTLYFVLGLWLETPGLYAMEGSKRSIFHFCKQLHTLTRTSPSPSDTFKKKIAELDKDRRRRNPKRNRLFVETPESLSWLDTASMPMFATVAGIALFAKLLMMVHYTIPL